MNRSEMVVFKRSTIGIDADTMQPTPGAVIVSRGMYGTVAGRDILRDGERYIKTTSGLWYKADDLVVGIRSTPRIIDFPISVQRYPGGKVVSVLRKGESDIDIPEASICMEYNGEIYVLARYYRERYWVKSTYSFSIENMI